MRALVIIPTYNERDNIVEMVRAVRANLPDANLLVVDDGSPDGTGKMVAEMGKSDPHVAVLQRAGKLGLGTAYIEGFRIAINDGYDCVIGMDADFSHDPTYLPQFVHAAEHDDLIVGSRYINGGSTPDWRLSRRLISRIGNGVARTVLGLPVRDCTTGYKCYRREVLTALDLDGIDLVGYGFLIETTYQAYRKGFRIHEIPITFIDRREGKSKMTGTIVTEALRYVFRRRWQRVRGRLSRRYGPGH